MDQHGGIWASFWPAGKVRGLCPVDPVSPPQDQEVQVEDTMEGEEGDSAEVKVAIRPKGPTKQERDEHNCTHIPYRVWCPICVKSRAVDDPHFAGKDLAVICVGHYFPAILLLSTENI